MRAVLRSIYLRLAPKGSKLYALTHIFLRKLLNVRYSYWIRHFDTYNQEQHQATLEELTLLSTKPLISVLMPVYNPNPEFLEQAIQSVLNQTYPYWELCIADDASTISGVKDVIEKHRKSEPRVKVVYRTTNGHISAASNTALAMAKGDFIALLDHDDLLHPLALFEVAKEINAYPDSVVIYSDEDKVTPRGSRIDPYFKSDFDLDLFLSQNMVSHLGVYLREALVNIGGFREGLEGSQDYDLMLRLLSRIEVTHIRHIPKVLYHWRISSQSVADSIDIKPYALKAGQQALRDHLADRMIKAQVNTFENFGYKIAYALQDPAPNVEIVFSSSQPQRTNLEILDSLIGQAEYDTSRLSLGLNLEASPPSRLTNALSSKYPRMNCITLSPLMTDPDQLNEHISQSKAEYFVLINDFCIDFSPGWLKILISFVNQDGIGSVSPKLVYKNSFIYCCGLILGKGGIPQRLFNGNSTRLASNYFLWSSLHKGYSALPHNCIVFEKAGFMSVGGFDSELKTLSAQQIDLCLKMRSAGFRNVVVPEALVTIDRVKRKDNRNVDEMVPLIPDDKAALMHRWAPYFEHDPAFNPNLTVHRGRPVVSKQPTQQNQMKS